MLEWEGKIGNMGETNPRPLTTPGNEPGTLGIKGLILSVVIPALIYSVEYADQINTTDQV